MFRKNLYKIPYFMAALFAVGFSLIPFQIEGKNNDAAANEGGQLITGTGTIDSTVIRCTTEIYNCGDQNPSTSIQIGLP